VNPVKINNLKSAVDAIKQCCLRFIEGVKYFFVKTVNNKLRGIGFSDFVTETDVKTVYNIITKKNKPKGDTIMSAIHLNNNNFNEAVNSDKPVLIDFWAPWCGPCRMVSPIMDEIAEENPQLFVAKVNVEEEPELAQAFGVMSIPMLVVMKDGKIINQSVGAKPKAQILALVK